LRRWRRRPMSAAGKRYAQALMASLGTAGPKKALADLEAFALWLSEVPALGIALENPGIPAEVKTKLVEDLGTAAAFDAVSIRFVHLAVANRRLRQWNELVAAFRRLCDEKRGVVRARIRTARPLSEAAKRDLAARLEKVLGGTVELEPVVSPALLGGVELRLGSTVYDGTVSGALRALHQDLLKG